MHVDLNFGWSQEGFQGSVSESLEDIKDIISREAWFAFEEDPRENLKEIGGSWKKGNSCYRGAESLTMRSPGATWKMDLMKCAVQLRSESRDIGFVSFCFVLNQKEVALDSSESPSIPRWLMILKLRNGSQAKVKSRQSQENMG